MTKLATVSYLNARPLIDGIEDETDIEMLRRVPSDLLDTLQSNSASIALCPIIDFQESPSKLEIVPVGAIGCRGPALTVKVFGQKPIETLDEIAVDTDSHTSVALLTVVMKTIYHRRPALRPIAAVNENRLPEAVLLIGDKVITATPDRDLYRHELDLGDAWSEVSDSPFVFAAWMTRAGSSLGDLPGRLDRLRRRNRQRLPQIAAEHASSSGWPVDLATSYLSRNLSYEFGGPEIAGVEEFWALCRENGVIDELRPMMLYRG